MAKRSTNVVAYGLRINYRQAGQGAPLVLLHGGWSDSRTWRHQLEGLSDKYKVIAWDAPGCGGSEDPPLSYRLDDYADSLAEFIQQVTDIPPHVLGLSWGGGLAIAFARRHPHLVRSLLLAGAYAGWAGSLSQEEVDRRFKKVKKDMTLSPSDWIDNYIPTWFSDDAPQHAVEEMRTMAMQARAEGSLPMLESFAEADLRDVLPTLDLPTLVIHAEKDTRAPLHVAQELHEKIPASRMVTIPGAGHVSNMEAPERFNQVVRDFLHEHQ
jgi:pimeloyl-ACP methyl ester carboxylesterase